MTMPELWSFASTSVVDVLGWTLVHFVWQGALLAAVLTGALYLLRDHTPRVRYAVSCIVLIALLALPIGTGVLLSQNGPSAETQSTLTVGAAPAELPARSGASTPDSAASPALSWRDQVATGLQPVLPWFVLGWGLGVTVFSIRFARGAWRVRQLRRASTPAPSRWDDSLRALSGVMGLQNSPALRVSEHVESPVVAGWWRPVILVPVGLLSGLPPKQVEALLLHELAHVRRHDVLVGRMQALVETLLFFHPATWWISRKIRQTREACCDDLAVDAGAERTVYARALAALAERMLITPRALGVVAADGASVLARVRRVLSPSSTPDRPVRRLSVAAALLLVLAVPLGVAACASQQTAKESASETATVDTEDASQDTIRLENRVVVISQDSTEDERPFRVRQGDSLQGSPVIMLTAPGHADSLRVFSKGMFNADTLKEHALQLRMHVDSLARHFDEEGVDERLTQTRRLRQLFTDSLFGFHRDSLDSEAFRFDGSLGVFRSDSNAVDLDSLVFGETVITVDSLLQHQEKYVDSLNVYLQRHMRPMLDTLHGTLRSRADSLRFQFGQEWSSEHSERLRERARRLREQAERLEERAEKMQTPPSPQGPEASDDTSALGDVSIPLP